MMQLYRNCADVYIFFSIRSNKLFMEKCVNLNAKLCLSAKRLNR